MTRGRRGISDGPRWVWARFLHSQMETNRVPSWTEVELHLLEGRKWKEQFWGYSGLVSLRVQALVQVELELPLLLSWQV